MGDARLTEDMQYMYMHLGLLLNKYLHVYIDNNINEAAKRNPIESSKFRNTRGWFKPNNF